MAEDQPTDPPPEEDQETDEDEQAWQRLSPRLRGLIREELDEADKRRAAAPKPQEVKPEPEPEKTTEEKPRDDRRPRRTAAELWFGRRS